MLASNSASALRDLVGMSYSSSPPLTRAFFTNMVPDFLVTAGPRWRARGLGGLLAVGYWGPTWGLDLASAWVDCGRVEGG